ncbi:MAG: MotA/TolQ/ExbB proton channel family protein [Desulfovibrio sp.]
MFEMLAKGGFLVYPILACLIVVAAVFVERVIAFSQLKLRGAGLAIETASLLKEGRVTEAREKAQKDNSTLGRVLTQAVDVHDADREMLETVLVSATSEEIRQMSRRTQLLATIGNIAPSLGLLGTVIGMIKAFMVIQEMGGKVNAAVLAGGIWEAMLTTALGLTVALPAILAHSYLISRIDKHEAGIQQGTVAFVRNLCGR